MCLLAEKMKKGPNDRDTIYTSFLKNLSILNHAAVSYIVGDAYYAVAPLIFGLKDQTNHLLTRMGHNTVGYKKPIRQKKKKGRKRKYGEKVKIYDLFGLASFNSLDVDLYGEKQNVEYYCADLYWKPVKKVVRFVLVKFPNGKGKAILMTTDITLSAKEIIETYGLRFKIEVGIKVAAEEIGTFSYRFWSKSHPTIKKGDGPHYTHKDEEEVRTKLEMKQQTYEIYVQLAVVVQAFCAYMAVFHPNEVWKNYSEWQRTYPKDLPRACPELIH